MMAIWVKARIKPGERQRFLKAIEVDALGSEGDEPGCLRFNVLQDAQDDSVYYFYEVYKDEAALEAHRLTPHYAVWKAVADVLDGPTVPTRCKWSCLLQQFCDFSLEREKLVVPQIGELERLQITLLRPHRKEHSRLASYRVRTQVHCQLDAETLVEALCYFEQSSGG